jgi:hypothetical protein
MDEQKVTARSWFESYVEFLAIGVGLVKLPKWEWRLTTSFPEGMPRDEAEAQVRQMLKAAIVPRILIAMENPAPPSDTVEEWRSYRLDIHKLMALHTAEHIAGIAKVEIVWKDIWED